VIESAKIEFPGAIAGKLAARLDLPAKPRACALFAHCFTCGKDIFAAARIAEGLTAHGIAVLRFDFTGTAAAKTNLPIPISRPTSATSWRQPIICGEIIWHRLCSSATV
jgi:predicted alpha/beta-hydrolase family hydrolase